MLVSYIYETCHISIMRKKRASGGEEFHILCVRAFELMFGRRPARQRSKLIPGVGVRGAQELK